MTKAILFLSLPAAWAMVWLLWDCSEGCQLTTVDLLIRWSSSLAAFLLLAWISTLRNRRRG
jgi:hypothetical protein